VDNVGRRLGFWQYLGMRIRFLPIACLVAILGLSACTTDNGPSAPTGRSTASSTTPSTTAPPPTPSRTGPLTTGPGVGPGEKPPVLTNDARQQTPLGALFFADYYFRALDWSIATNDPYLLRQISSPRCVACARAIDGLTSLKAEGSYLRGGQITIDSAEVDEHAHDIPADYAIIVTTTQAAEQLFSSTAAPSSVAAKTTTKSTVLVTWVSGRWQVVEVESA
jgi:hypothetical protein